MKGEMLYKILRPVFTAVFRLYFNPSVEHNEYIPKNGSAVIAGNHKHALDPILVDICTRRVVHTLAKKELHEGLFGGFFKAVGTIPVDLNAPKNKAALNAAIHCLREGKLVNVSPEAKRNYTQELLLPFKFGAVVMAKQTDSVIVPYAITGDYTFRSKNLKITFGAPLDLRAYDVEQANVMLFDKVKSLLENGNE